MEYLNSGQFTGEFALLKDIRPKFTIRASTFMLMKVIKKSEIETILKSYPNFTDEYLAAAKAKK